MLWRLKSRVHSSSARGRARSDFLCACTNHVFKVSSSAATADLHPPAKQKSRESSQPTMNLIVLFLVAMCASPCLGKMAFEKLTSLDYRGRTYYTVKNLTLYECQGWCREEQDCKAAAFSFVINPLAPIQETLCQLQNETMADNPTVLPQRAVSMYYFVKLHVRSENICDRPWTFERVPNKILKGYNTLQVYTSSKEACLAACLNEKDFVCRSVEYNYATLQCNLSDSDRRTNANDFDLVDNTGVDYFENLCLQADDACPGTRNFTQMQYGVPQTQVAQFVDLNFWIDKEVVAPSKQACRRACQLESDFICRSYLFKDPAPNQQTNCQLYHLDHISFPDGASTFVSNPPLPLIDNGENYGTYYEMVCNYKATPQPAPSTLAQSSVASTTPNLIHRQDSPSCDNFGVCYDVSVNCRDTRIEVQMKTNKNFNGRVYALGRSETCNVDVSNKDNFHLDLTMSGQDCNTQSVGGVFSNTIVIQHHSVVMTKADKLYKIRCTYDISARNVTYGMMSIGSLESRSDPQMINVTAAPEAPPPRIVILGVDGREAAAVRIGDSLTFRIEIPDETPYGIFARSCFAMAKDSKSTFQIIDEKGCPVDSGIFPKFVQDGTALQSDYEAFRFTESYGVIFQCNVKYCLGPCEPVQCGNGRETESSWGRKRRSVNGIDKSERPDEEMTLSQEILVLDLNDDDPEMFKHVAHNETVEIRDQIRIIEGCPTKTSVMALSVACGLLLLIYVCTLFYFLLRKWTVGADKMNRM